GELLRADVDLNVDRWLGLIGRQGARRIRILEREVLDVLPKHAELCLALRSALARRGPAIAAGGRHRLYLSLPTKQSAAWLTQARGRDKDITCRAWPYAAGGAPDGGFGAIRRAQAQ